MEIGASPLFRGISEESQQAMRTCFDMREVSFRADEVIYDFGAGRNMVGVLAEGAAVIERIDQQGSRTILERLESGGVFGEMLMFENVAGDSITVVAETACRVWFMAADQVTKRCEKACTHHTQVVENMFQLVAEKATSLYERVEVLSRRSIRDKLMCYFSLMAAKKPQRGVLAAVFPQCAGGLYLHGPQRHDAGAEEDAAGGTGGCPWPESPAAAEGLSRFPANED